MGRHDYMKPGSIDKNPPISRDDITSKWDKFNEEYESAKGMYKLDFIKYVLMIYLMQAPKISLSLIKTLKLKTKDPKDLTRIVDDEILNIPLPKLMSALIKAFIKKSKSFRSIKGHLDSTFPGQTYYTNHEMGRLILKELFKVALRYWKPATPSRFATEYRSVLSMQKDITKILK